MKLFSKSKSGMPDAASPTPTFQPIDRVNLLGLLDRIVNQGDSCVLRIREPRGAWTYAFQGGGLTHASGGAVRGARHAFDLLWEFQQGEVNVAPGVDASLSSNLYIDKGRLLDLLRRSQASLTGPGSPYIPPDQQRPIQPVRQPWPQPGQVQRPSGPPPGWNPAPQPQPGYPAVPPQGYPAAPPPGYPAGPPPGYPAVPPPGYQAAPRPGYPSPPPPGYPAPQPQGPPAGYPVAPGYPGQPAQQMPRPPQGQPGQQWPGYPPQPPQAPPQPYRAQPMAPPPPPAAAPPAPPRAQPPQQRPVTPPTFSVPPMPLPKPRGTVNLPSAPPPPMPAPPSQGPAPRAATPVDELQTLRASLVSQAPQVPAAGPPPGWSPRGPAPVVPLPPAPARGKSPKAPKAPKVGRPSPFRAWARVQLITFLLWACERRYSEDDHWTVKDAFEVATLELRDQFFGAFSQSLQGAKGTKRPGTDEFEGDQIASGRTRGRNRGRKR